MILFYSRGRLGNQLFQYAFLNTIAKKDEKIIAANMELFVENFVFSNESFKHLRNKYLLFCIRKLFIPYLLEPLAKLKLIGYIQQKRTQTSALPSTSRGNGLLPVTFVCHAYFQSEDFFDPEKVDFILKEEYLLEAQNFLDEIPIKSTKIFVHVRRGDYVSLIYLEDKGIDLPKSYFENAMKVIKKNIENPFFIFLTDDPNYVECCFEHIENKIISKKCMQTDLAIMSLCEYGIVSNSSFSWWGAYMMKNRRKVIFPKYWYGWKQKIDSHVGIQPKWAEVTEVEK